MNDSSLLRLDLIRRIHLVGICGTGMASLAAMLKDRGFAVTGSDEGIYPPMSDFLAEKGIPAQPGYNLANLQPEPDLVVIGNALSRGNPEIEYVLNFKLPYMSFPEAVKNFFLRGKISIVVTGTHGKTTTSAMIAWVLHHAGLRPDFLVGGMLHNLDSSYALEGGRHFVIEGDEYDSAFFDKGPKFLHYLPEIAVINNVEYDHADIYPDLESIHLQFRRFINLIPERGLLVLGAESPGVLEVSRKAFCRTTTFGLDSRFDWSAAARTREGDRQGFDILYRRKLFRRVRVELHGAHNVRNCLAAAAVLHHAGVPEDALREGLETFRGVRRRLQFVAEIGGVRIYEDFAHHPTAVRETLQAMRESFNPRRLWAIYEPRSATSRRNVFQREIAEALAVADLVTLPELFRPERVPEGERLDVNRLVGEVRELGRAAWNVGTVDGIIRKVVEEAQPGDWIVILSNGGFGGIYTRLPEALRVR